MELICNELRGGDNLTSIINSKKLLGSFDPRLQGFQNLKAKNLATPLSLRIVL